LGVIIIVTIFFSAKGPNVPVRVVRIILYLCDRKKHTHTHILMANPMMTPMSYRAQDWLIYWLIYIVYFS
jgi:hypothetical protein